MTADEMREMQWVQPELVAQIRFVEWTAEGRLRHAAFLGLRSDKRARGAAVPDFQSRPRVARPTARPIITGCALDSQATMYFAKPCM